MSGTAQHRSLDQAQTAVDALSLLDLHKLSYIQLHRLQKILLQVSADVAAETERRAEAGAAGDTVKVPSPKI
jgi:hypothetical protein